MHAAVGPGGSGSATYRQWLQSFPRSHTSMDSSSTSGRSTPANLGLALKVLAVLPTLAIAPFALVVGMVVGWDFFEPPRDPFNIAADRHITGLGAIFMLASGVAPGVLLWMIIAGPERIGRSWLASGTVLIVGALALVCAGALVILNIQDRGAQSPLLVLLLAPACIVGVFELARLVLFFWRRAVGRAGLHG